MPKVFTLKMKVKVKKEKSWTCDIRLQIIDSIKIILFCILTVRRNTFTQKITYIHTQRETEMSIMSKICKVDLPKKFLTFPPEHLPSQDIYRRTSPCIYTSPKLGRAFISPPDNCPSRR